MKIAYFTEWSPNAPTGVLRKIIGQVTAWKALGHEVRLYSLSTLSRQPAALDFDVHGKVYGRIPEEMLKRYPLARLGYINKIVTAPAIARAIRSFSPHIVYYRQQGPWYPGLGRILSGAPYVMEINSLPSEARYWGWTMGLLTGVTNGRLWSRASGFVCVAHSGAKEFTGLGKPVRVVPNSMWGDPGMRLPPSGNARPAFVFVGTEGQAWHGIDKIVALAKHLPDCDFHIVGCDPRDRELAAVSENVIVHGRIFGKDLLEIYRRSDIGLGTLALHRLGFDNTSSLKTLEYLMYGLPVVLGCRETADELNTAEYTLSLPNNETNALDNIGAIREFADRWRNKRVTADLSFLSRDAIEPRRLEFFAELALPAKSEA